MNGFIWAFMHFAMAVATSLVVGESYGFWWGSAAAFFVAEYGAICYHDGKKTGRSA